MTPALGIGAMCLAPGKCDDNHTIWDADGNFAQLRQQLDGVYAAIDKQFPRHGRGRHPISGSHLRR
jgi:hypothetical protein